MSRRINDLENKIVKANQELEYVKNSDMFDGNDVNRIKKGLDSLLYEYYKTVIKVIQE